MLLLLCAQAILAEQSSAPTPAKTAYFATASTTGAFLVLADAGAVHVLDGTTLLPVRKIDVSATAVGFDDADETLTVVGDAWLRYDTRSWKEVSRHELPGAAFRKRVSGLPGFEAGQALATPDGAVYYRSEDAHLSKAVLDDGDMKVDVLSRNRVDSPTVERVLCLAGPVALVDGGVTCIVLRGRQYRLAASTQPLAAASLGGRVVVVMKEAEGFYDARTWKTTWHREAANVAAAFDFQRGRVFCAGRDALRYWSPEKPEVVGTLAGRYRAIAIDGASRTLYAIDTKTVWSWRLKD